MAKATPADIAIVREKMHRAIALVFGENVWSMAEYILNRESGFDPGAVNKYSGACGLGQADPCSKLSCNLTIADVDCQIQWEVNYFENHWHSNIAAAYQSELTNNSY